MAAMDKARQVLKQYYGYDHFRRGQEAIISQIMDGKDTLGMMPTGGGKSVCYQVPAMLLSGVTLVISPLISLMKDQVDTLANIGIPATYVNSSLNPAEIDERLAAASKGAYKLIYLAPERLEFPPFLHLLENINVSLIAVDEAHCISQWGPRLPPKLPFNRKTDFTIQAKAGDACFNRYSDAAGKERHLPAAPDSGRKHSGDRFCP
ncbi:UNVERIFIED_ORG: superfamily II DNA helicase RecQ [Heyndrickxia coagulans]